MACCGRSRTAGPTARRPRPRHEHGADVPARIEVAAASGEVVLFDPRMIVSRMQVRWLTCVMVRPAWRRAAAGTSPMLTRRLRCPIAPRPAHGAVAVTDSFSPGSLIGNAHQAPASGCQPARTGVVSRPVRCRVSAATRTRPLWHPQAPPPRSEPGSPARARARPWPSGGGHRARRRRFPSGSGDRRPQAGPVPVSCSLASAPGRRARTSPMAGSWLAGSGSGRCAWIW